MGLREGNRRAGGSIFEKRPQVILQTYFLVMGMLLLDLIFLAGERMTGHLEQTSEKSTMMSREERGNMKAPFKDTACLWKYHHSLQPPDRTH